MDLIYLGDNVTDGLELMMREMVGNTNDLVHKYVPIEHALLIVEVAKRTPDKPEYFPRGKWGIVLNIENRIHKALDKALGEHVKN